MDKPSISIWIDPITQAVKVDFTPQMLQPAEYGIVISTLLVHIARQFQESNPGVDENVIIDQINKGLLAGIEQRDDMVLPSKSH